jgi:WD40 repeat protein
LKKKYILLIIVVVAALFFTDNSLAKYKKDKPKPELVFDFESCDCVEREIEGDCEIIRKTGYFTKIDSTQLDFSKEVLLIQTYTQYDEKKPQIIKVHLWNTSTGKYIGNVDGSRPVLSEDGSLIAYTSSPENIIKIWDTRNNSTVKTSYIGIPLEFSPDTSRLLINSKNNDDGEFIAMLDLYNNKPISSCVNVHDYCPDKKSVFINNTTAVAAMCNRNGHGILVFKIGDSCALEEGVNVSECAEPWIEFSISSNGKLVAVSDVYEGTIHIYRVDKISKIQTINRPSNSDERLYFNQESTQIKSSYGQKKIRVWEIKTGKVLSETDFDGSKLDFEGEEKHRITFDPCHPVIHIKSTKDNKALATLTMLNEDWVLQAPDGYFDASEGSKKYFNWRVGEKTYPAKDFWKKYHRPGLLAQILK